MNTTTNIGFGLIDAQRGFMPEAEGIRLGLDGFGELPITDGDLIVPNINLLLGAFATSEQTRFTTRDWHPRITAHFADEPNFTTTWPTHCVNNTPGAMLHPEIIVPKATYDFVKGTEPLENGADDTSYSGFNATERNGSLTPNELMRKTGVKTLVLAGLALDYCVGLTAVDFKQKTDLEVVVVTDATKPVTEQTGSEMLAKFKELGIKTMSTQEALGIVASS